MLQVVYFLVILFVRTFSTFSCAIENSVSPIIDTSVCANIEHFTCGDSYTGEKGEKPIIDISLSIDTSVCANIEHFTCGNSYTGGKPIIDISLLAQEHWGI